MKSNRDKINNKIKNLSIELGLQMGTRKVPLPEILTFSNLLCMCAHLFEISQTITFVKTVFSLNPIKVKALLSKSRKTKTLRYSNLPFVVVYVTVWVNSLTAAELILVKLWSLHEKLNMTKSTLETKEEVLSEKWIFIDK